MQEARYFPEIRFSPDKITIRYNKNGGMGPRRLDTVLLTISGAVVSTTDEEGVKRIV
jgi:hypothetical protein